MKGILSAPSRSGIERISSVHHGPASPGKIYMELFFRCSREAYASETL